MVSREGLSRSRLGFGCAHLPGRLNVNEALALIEAALDCGIHHFDVARMYGDGRAEGILGEAARRWRDRMTIVTKAGIWPASRAPMARAWRKTMRALPPLAKSIPPGLGDWAQPRFDQFAPADIRHSVETSLRELKTDHVDALLLHECAPRHVTDALKRVLEDLRAEGKIARWGLASSPAETTAMVSAHPDLCGIVQVAAEAAATSRPPGSHLILHSVLGGRFNRFARQLADDERLAERLHAELGVATEDIAALFLQDALARSPDATVLFSSSRCENIRRNAGILAAPSPEHLDRLQAFLAYAA